MGNPWHVGVDGTRDEIVQKHRDWLDGKIIKHLVQRTSVLKKIHELKGHVLGY